MAETEQRLTLKVLTINTHKGFAAFNRRFILPELREAVRSISADIVFLQEVLGAHERHSKRFSNWPTAPQYEFLADAIWPDFAYGRNAVYPHGHHGNALLSKFPIATYKNTDVSLSGTERRGMLHCVLHIPQRQGSVHAICVHLGLRESHRQRQLEMLCDYVAMLPAEDPLIIAGDFNDWRCRATAVLQRRAGLEEVFTRAHGHPQRTFPARFPLLALDRIYVRNAHASHPSVMTRAPWSRLSDHSPLAVEVHL